MNNKRYVGQTKNLKRRVKGHFTDFRGDTLLTRAVKKHGREAFQIITLEECSDERVDEREKFWIAHFDTTNHQLGYNCEEGGNACKTLTPETRQKISDARKAWFASMTKEERAAYRASKCGHVPSDDVRLARSLKMSGRAKTEEHKAKIAAAHLGKRHPEGCTCKVHGSRRKLSDEQLSELHKLLADGASVSALSERFGVSGSTIKRMLAL